MLRTVAMLSVIGCLALSGAVNTAMAQIGEPKGAFDITVRQGASVVAQHTVTIGPGGDLQDLKAMFQDGTPEDFTQIGTVGAPGHETPIILKVTSDGGPDESFRVLHWYLDAPASTSDIYSPGPNSLFDPSGGGIDVTITSLEFDNGAITAPFLPNNSTYLTSFMRDYQGHFYESSMANPYATMVEDIQVPASAYLDGNAALYDFVVSQTGASVSWTWDNLENPGLGTNVHNGLGSVAPIDPGYVFELGLSMAYVVVPEPATLSLLTPVMLVLFRRRQRR